MTPRTSIPPRVNRREMLRRILRLGGLAALGATAATLVRRSAGRDCNPAESCSACPLFVGCSLPKAEAATRDVQGSRHPHDDE